MSEENGYIEDSPRQEEPSCTLAQDIFQTLSSLVRFMLIIILLSTFVVRISVVDGESMLQTLFDRDVVLVRTLFYTPKQGDIVVLTKTSFREQSIIKRVIAVGGQTVDIDYRTSTVYVDGEAQEEPWMWEAMKEPWWDHPTHIEVPEGSIFVLGDNRNNSSDSRWPPIGVVDTRCVIGQAVVVAFPFADMKVL